MESRNGRFQRSGKDGYVLRVIGVNHSPELMDPRSLGR